jgi:hypothetical protein
VQSTRRQVFPRRLHLTLELLLQIIERIPFLPGKRPLCTTTTTTPSHSATN